jgi:hypothetical protein
MISVAAAALIAGTGFANAQGTGASHESPSAAAPAQSGGASDRGASERGTSARGEMNRDAAKPEMKSTQSEQQSPAAGKNQRAEEKNMSGEKNQRADEKSPRADEKNQRADEKNMSGEKNQRADEKSPRADEKNQRAEEKNMSGEKKGMRSENENAKTDTTKGGKDMKAEGNENRNGRMNADSTRGAESKTVGQAGAGAKLSSEQRTRITSVIKEQHVRPVDNVNFSISVGTRVPRDVSFHPLPAEIVSIYPDWRGYEFVLVRDQIVVIDPQTYEIVAVLDA